MASRAGEIADQGTTSAGGREGGRADGGPFALEHLTVEAGCARLPFGGDLLSWIRSTSLRSSARAASPGGRVDPEVLAGDLPQRPQAFEPDRRIVVFHAIEKDLVDPRVVGLEQAEALDRRDPAVLELVDAS